MPRVSAARSRGTRSVSLQAAAICATGVTETRLFTMGMPYSRSRLSAVSTRCSAVVVMWSYTLVHMRSRFSSAQPISEMPMVMVRMSRFCSETIPRVSAISAGVIDMRLSCRCMRLTNVSILYCCIRNNRPHAAFLQNITAWKPLETIEGYFAKTRSAMRADSAASLA